MAHALIFGAGGQLGVEMVAELEQRGHVAVGLGRKQLDVTSADAVEEAVRTHKPQWVINCAAYNQVDLAEKEPETAMKVNGLAVRGLALACRNAGATLMHFSTDHVFDGLKDTPYTEADPPNPPSAYAVSKLAGEHYARAYLDEAYIVRVAGVFGPAGRYTRRGNFTELVLSKAEAGSTLRVVDDFFATPTYAPALASRCVELLETGKFGLYHVGGGTTISWYEYALKICEVAGVEAEIEPTNHREYVTPARRPRCSPLSNARIEALGIAKMPPLEDALRDYMKRREALQASPPSGGSR